MEVGVGGGDEANCFHKRPDGTVLGFVGHVVSVAALTVGMKLIVTLGTSQSFSGTTA